MTARNSVLLILKQSPGIEFNALLAKTSSNYGSLNSARAALSRAIKDLNARGMIQKKGKRFFATDKGLAQLGNEMKTKLILKLNEMVKHRNAVENIDEIIQLLSTLIERSKQDTDLLKAARGNVSFSLEDLFKVRQRLEEKTSHYNYLNSVLLNQIEAMKQLNFSDSLALEWSKKTKKQVEEICLKVSGQEITIECLNSSFLEKAIKHFSQSKSSEKNIFLPKTQIKSLLRLAEETAIMPSNPINVYAGSIKIQLNKPKVFFMGSSQELEEIKAKK